MPKMTRYDYMYDIELHCGDFFDEEPHIREELKQFTKEQLKLIELLTDVAYVYGKETYKLCGF